ncbi:MULTISPECIES: hypothetical protein [Pseudomonas]|uniref:hypothetical protein n=1 Tax=Pseudomonas TaxID=286 RepID=UPI001BE65BA3|nr:MULTISPECIES: hypothetical protein [Pseudomonas]MBT2339347.1 hypothetical protein [Pseudomonas fluorescens]MCD4530935.1 hypothetical protein [Pseudomonas sp. C3-2018]
MTIPDSNPERQSGTSGHTRPEDHLNHIKEDVNEAIGSAREQADAHFGQYRDTAADQIDALARGAKSAMSEIEANDTLGLSHYLADMADSMSGLAGKLRNMSAEQMLHDGTRLARENPGLFLAGSVAVGFGLSRFLKAGSSPVAADVEDPAAGHSNPPHGGFAGREPFDAPADPIGPGASTASGLATGITPASPSVQDHPSDAASGSLPGSANPRGEL